MSRRVLPKENQEALRRFWDSLRNEEKKKFCDACKTTLGYMRLIMYGGARPGLDLGEKLIKQSHGYIRAQDIFPELFDDEDERDFINAKYIERDR